MKYLTILAFLSQCLYACEQESALLKFEDLPPEMVVKNFLPLEHQDLAALTLTSSSMKEVVCHESFRREWAVTQGIVCKSYTLPNLSTDYLSLITLYHKWTQSMESFTNFDIWAKLVAMGCEPALNQYYLRSRPIITGLLCSVYNQDGNSLYDSGIDFFRVKFKDLTYFACDGSAAAQNNLMLTFLHLTKILRQETSNVNNALLLAADVDEERYFLQRAKKVINLSQALELPSTQTFMTLIKRFAYQHNSFAQAVINDAAEGAALSRIYAEVFVREFRRANDFKGTATWSEVAVYIPKNIIDLLEVKNVQDC